MGPRPSISGELPINSYFNSAGDTRNKKNGSMKRRSGAGADDASANRTQTKKQRTGQSSKGTNVEAQEKSRSGSAEARPKAAGVFGTTSIPTPVSVAKLPRSTPSQVSADMEVITITSSSPPRATLLDTGDPVRTARNTASGSGLPTPQTISQESKKNPRIDVAVPLPMPTVSRSVMNSGPAIPSVSPRPPVTPSRPRIKPDHIPLVYRTTPHSQRIVPSSQLFDDERPNLASSLEANRDPFLLHLTDEPSSFPDELSLPPSSDVPSQTFSTLSLASAKLRVSAYPTYIEHAGDQGCSLENNLDTGTAGDTRIRPLFLSGSSRSVLLSSSGLGPRDRGQSSQFEPTSQFDEIEMRVLSQRLLFVDTIPVPQTNHCDMAPSVERSQTGPLQERSSHSETIVEQESSSTGHCHKPSPPTSPLTPLSSSSSLLSDAMGTIGANRSPSQHALPKTPESRAPRSTPEPMVDLGLGGTAQLPIEDPTSREDVNSLVHLPSVSRCPPPAKIRSTTFPAGDSPSPGAGARSHPRISHVKLRGLPDATVELDSDGEEMSPASSFSLPATSQEMSLASSCLDLVGTLPSEVGDFLDMVDAYTFSEA